MELSLSHTLHLFNIFREYDGKENPRSLSCFIGLAVTIKKTRSKKTMSIIGPIGMPTVSSCLLARRIPVYFLYVPNNT